MPERSEGASTKRRTWPAPLPTFGPTRNPSRSYKTVHREVDTTVARMRGSKRLLNLRRKAGQKIEGKHRHKTFCLGPARTRVTQRIQDNTRQHGSPSEHNINHYISRCTHPSIMLIQGRGPLVFVNIGPRSISASLNLHTTLTEIPVPGPPTLLPEIPSNQTLPVWFALCPLNKTKVRPSIIIQSRNRGFY